MKKPPPPSPFDRFLRRMQVDGRSNMYGAVPYLMKAFGLDRQTAFGVVCDWLDRQAQSSPVNPRGTATIPPG